VPILGTTQIDLSPIEGHNLSGHYRGESTTDCHNSDQVQQRKARGQLTEADRTLLTILELSGLTLDKEVEKANLVERKQRQLDLDDASATLTRAISDRWGQRKYEVAFRGDGQLFYTFVKDQHDPSLIELEERSKGFQWFFSFDLMFMYETKGTFANCVIPVLGNRSTDVIR
jgi:hypothetical protein